MKAFQIKVNGKMLDYRLGGKLNLEEVKAFFAKKYRVEKLWSAGRHIMGLFIKDRKKLLLKLATTKGISALTEREFAWNEQFNLAVSRSSSNYWVPQNYASGFYDDLFYLITDQFDGQLLVEKPEESSNSKIIMDYLHSIIGFAEMIEELKINGEEKINHQQHFLKKTQAWFEDIPQQIREKYQISELLKMVESSCFKLQGRSRHGDFTPWHLMFLEGGKLGLIDGEHWLSHGVENYDLCYFLQRVYSVLENPTLAREILNVLIKRGYKMEKLRTILASRAIGGFLDETLKREPNYQMATSFKEFVKLA